MEEYKSNSFKSKENKTAVELPKFEKAISGSVKSYKKGPANKLIEAFLPDDVTDIKSYLGKCAKDTFVPMIKNSFISFIAASLGVDAGRFTGSSFGGTKVAPINYNYISSNKQSANSAQRTVTGRSVREFDALIFDNQGAAKIVLEQMCDIIQEYGFVTIAAFYDLSGYYGDNTTNKFGWNDLSTARIMPVGGGYMIKLPNPIPRE